MTPEITITGPHYTVGNWYATDGASYGSVTPTGDGWTFTGFAAPDSTVTILADFDAPVILAGPWLRYSETTAQIGSDGGEFYGTARGVPEPGGMMVAFLLCAALLRRARKGK